MPISLSFRDVTWDRQADRCSDRNRRLSQYKCASL